MKKEELIRAFCALGIPELEGLTDLCALPGKFINLEYTLPSGQKVKLLDDEKTYLGSEIHKVGSHRCYGLAAGDGYLLVCEYGDGGTDAEIVVYQRLRQE